MFKLADLIKSELWRSRSIVLTVLSLFLGSFFILMGTLKITPMISLDIHRELRRNYIHFAKLIPFISYFGWKLSPKLYRTTFGLLELFNGIVLALVPFRRAKLLANILLLFLSIFSMFNNYLAGYKFDRIAPCIVFTLMLACRLIVEYQVQRREYNWQLLMAKKNGKSFGPAIYCSTPETTKQTNQTTEMITANLKINHDNDNDDNQSIRMNNTKPNTNTYQKINDNYRLNNNNNQHTKMD